MSELNADEVPVRLLQAAKGSMRHLILWFDQQPTDSVHTVQAQLSPLALTTSLPQDMHLDKAFFLMTLVLFKWLELNLSRMFYRSTTWRSAVAKGELEASPQALHLELDLFKRHQCRFVSFNILLKACLLKPVFTFFPM